MDILVDIVLILLRVLMFAIIGRAILSWFSLPPNHPVVVVLNEITDPILSPLRRIVPQAGMFDFTPFIAILILIILTRIVELI